MELLQNTMKYFSLHDFLCSYPPNNIFFRFVQFAVENGDGSITSKSIPSFHLLPSKNFAIHQRLTIISSTQTRNQGGKPHLEKFSPSLEKCVGHGLKLLDIVQKNWAPLRKPFDLPGVPSWLRACIYVSWCVTWEWV